MQMYSIFDVESITVSPTKEIWVPLSESKSSDPPMYYHNIQVKYKGGTALLTFYSNDKTSLEVYHDIKEPK